MKKYIYIWLFLLCQSNWSIGQAPSVYKNPVLGVAFQSSSQWIRLDNGNSDVLELENQNHNLLIKMWHEQSEEDISGYLNTYLLKEGWASRDEAFELIVDNKKAKGIVGFYNEMHSPVKVLLLAIDDDEGFYVIRLKCPDECYMEHQKQLDKLISSVKWLNRSESHLFYAVHKMSS